MNKLLVCLAAAVLGCWPTAPSYGANGSVAAAMARRASVHAPPPSVATDAAAPQQNKAKVTTMKGTPPGRVRSRA